MRLSAVLGLGAVCAYAGGFVWVAAAQGIAPGAILFGAALLALAMGTSAVAAFYREEPHG